ncbi:HtrA protease/chaperone protein [hydrothermal vent metagenome]|uniref:Probable periplasmic serine endoprotease DegP-like n=1 Tax=hydrothermal vent metagenome TaxID=652676 RepID=A0A3B0TU55_9ZZZZ
MLLCFFSRSRIRSRLVAATVLALTLALTPQVLQAQSAPESFADLAERLSDAVVNISTSQTTTASRSVPRPNLPEGSPFQEFFDEFFKRNEQGNSRPRKVNSLGSGFVIDKSGLVVTNNHVIDGADEIFVIFNDGTKLKATVKGSDKKTDLALLEVKPKKPLVALEFGDSNALRVGDWVLAIGNPFGLGGTVTAGIVSARNRDINSGPYDDFIQTDASINRGNSGGPLFNMDGKVVGVNTAIISPSGGSIGIGFSVPSAIAVPVIAQLREFGQTRRGWLGVRIQTVTDEIAEGLGLGEARGALVAGVNPDGPAGKVDIQPGDVIVKFGGKEVKEMRDLPRIVAESSIDAEAEVEIIRKGKALTRKVVVALLKEDTVAEVNDEDDDKDTAKGEKKTAETLGLTLVAIDDDMREALDIAKDIEGAMVVDVDADSPAAGQGITKGDIIVAVNQEEVKSPQDVVSRISQARKDGRTRALLLTRGKSGAMRFIAVPLED